MPECFMHLNKFYENHSLSFSIFGYTLEQLIQNCTEHGNENVRVSKSAFLKKKNKCVFLMRTDHLLRSVCID